MEKAYKTYFLLNTETGIDIKIGRSINPKQRLGIIQPGNHSRLKLIAVLDEDKEKELHLKFAKYKTLGEWFRLEGELLDYINELIEDGTDCGTN